MKLAILSVHDRHPKLWEDQIERLGRCAGPARAALGAELRLWPIIHSGTLEEAVEAVRAGCAESGGFASVIDLRDHLLPEEGGAVHGQSLAEAYRRLRRDGMLEDGDLLAVLDHDAHPLRTDLFAILGRRLLAEGPLAGLGIPQWYHGRCYLHPALLLTRVATIEEMGPDAAFPPKPFQPEDPGWYDTCEGFTIWCEQQGRPTLPLRVISTGFPLERWDSDMAPGGGIELTGAHGERVLVGHLMRFGLEPDLPLASHIWASFLGPYRKPGFSPWSWDEVLAAYLSEPLAEPLAGP